jgi:hypothetical protein
VTIPLSADVKLSNGGTCNTHDVSLIVHYLDDSTPSLTVPETNGGMMFWIEDMHAVKNMTFPGAPAPVVVQYEDAASGGHILSYTSYRLLIDDRAARDCRPAYLRRLVR